MSGLMWTEATNDRWSIGEKNSVTKGDAAFSLHESNGRAWILKRYRGKMFVAGPYSWRLARKVWNEEIV